MKKDKFDGELTELGKRMKEASEEAKSKMILDMNSLAEIQSMMKLLKKTPYFNGKYEIKFDDSGIEYDSVSILFTCEGLVINQDKLTEFIEHLNYASSFHVYSEKENKITLQITYINFVHK